FGGAYPDPARAQNWERAVLRLGHLGHPLARFSRLVAGARRARRLLYRSSGRSDVTSRPRSQGAAMSRVLIIGAGGVGNVVAHKCAQNPEVFTDIFLASRTLARCEGIQKSVLELQGRMIDIRQVDADDVKATTKLLEEIKPDLLINVALPYQDLSLMEACLAAGVDYLDTANYEPPDVAKFEYSWQWAYREKFEAAGRMALLGSGFDPGVTNVFCAYAQKEL